MRKKKGSKKTSPNRQEDYNLKQSLGKLNQRKEFPSSETSTRIDIKKQESQEINQSKLNENTDASTTSLYLKLHDNFNTRYDTLNENIISVSDKINTSSDSLRQELEKKIEVKLDTRIFIWSILVLTAIASVIYALSYSETITDTRENKSQIKILHEHIENNEADLKKVENEINRIDKFINSHEKDHLKKK